MHSRESADRARVWRHLETLAEKIGSRLSGTPGADAAVDYIRSHLEASGATVEVQSFACPSWTHESTLLELGGGPAWVPLTALAQTFSPAAGLQATLAVVGSIDELEYLPDLEGKALVVHGKLLAGINSNRNHALLTAEERGAAALIVVNVDETMPSKLLRDPFLRIPGVCVPNSVGQRLRQAGGADVRLTIDARPYSSTGYNVIGHLPGDMPGRVLVVAHYDSAAITSGASDNASGTAVILEVCEALAGASQHRVGIDIVAFGAEEYGRHRSNLGAVEYVRRNPVAMADAVAVVEVDTVGLTGMSRSAAVVGFAGQVGTDLATMLREHYGFTVDVCAQGTGRDGAFDARGLPAVVVWEWFDGSKIPIHTVLDSISLLDPDAMRDCASGVIAAVEALAAGSLSAVAAT